MKNVHAGQSAVASEYEALMLYRDHEAVMRTSIRSNSDVEGLLTQLNAEVMSELEGTYPGCSSSTAVLDAVNSSLTTLAAAGQRNAGALARLAYFTGARAAIITST